MKLPIQLPPSRIFGTRPGIEARPVIVPAKSLLAPLQSVGSALVERSKGWLGKFAAPTPDLSEMQSLHANRGDLGFDVIDGPANPAGQSLSAGLRGRRRG